MDGTFVDMLTAISSGDWAMLGMCCLAFVPGAKVMKGLKAVGGIGKASKVLKSAPKMADGTAVYVKKGTLVHRAGGPVGSGSEHGRSYSLQSMKGMTRSDIITKCGIPGSTGNPVSHHLTYVANQGFWAEAGTSVGGVWPELRLAKGQGAKVLDFVEQAEILL